MGEHIFRFSLSLGLVFLILSLFALAFVNKDAPEVVPAVLSVAINLLTVIGSWLVLRFLASKRNKNR
jgi:mannose/fructose/N-acetylgalactosamine-specific phosphotransferase system component IIC